MAYIELAPGLEPGTCCLQDSCAADCATPANALYDPPILAGDERGPHRVR